MAEVPAEIRRVFQEADCLYTGAEVEAAIIRMAAAITAELAGANPLVLAVMLGGLVPAGKLLPLFEFPLRLDYVHATRYRETTRGADLVWLKQPPATAGETVLILDDILDEGHTLAAIVDACREGGARRVYTAVLVDKQLPRRGGLARADFTGLTIPNRYVFGYGMDYHGYLRNSPGIYAVKES